MAFSDRLLEEGAPIWAAQTEHPFVVGLAEGTLSERHRLIGGDRPW